MKLGRAWWVGQGTGPEPLSLSVICRQRSVCLQTKWRVLSKWKLEGRISTEYCLIFREKLNLQVSSQQVAVRLTSCFGAST